MAIGTGTVTLSEIINEFNGPNNIRSYLKCSGAAPTTSSYSSPVTSTTITAPANATYVTIKVWGAGGGGGSVGSAEFAAGGGGSGSYVEKSVAVVGGTTQFTYGIGAGGAAGAYDGVGDAGGSSNVSSAVLATTLNAEGGFGGESFGPGGQGGTVAEGGDTNIVGVNGSGGFATDGGAGGSAPNGGAGGVGGITGNAGAGSAPGAGGGGSGSDVGSTGGAGADGKVEFLWYTTSRIAAHENNTNIPTSGTLKFSNFRSTGTYVVDRDFVSDSYTGVPSVFIAPYFSVTYYEIKSGIYTADASTSLGINYNTTVAGTLGTVETIGKSIRTPTGSTKTCSINSILDYSIFSPVAIPNKAALVLSGDQRISTQWDDPWTQVEVTLTATSTIKTLYRNNSIVPNGTYDSLRNLTYWAWNDIFGFDNSGSTPFNFKTSVRIT